MKKRTLGKTGYKVTEVSLGTWQLGARWGDPFDEKTAERTLRAAVDAGINFFDTADKYSNGLSERAIGKFVKSAGASGSGRIYVATKCGRRLDPHTTEGYNEQNIRRFIEDSLKNMGLETLDLVQLHCPTTDVYYKPEVFDTLDALRAEGKIRHYGVSVEKVEQALKAIEYPHIATVQIIFNMFRQRPSELLFREARRRNVGIIVRVPLASGLLTGTFTEKTTFGKEDHRTFNRKGARFDRGETFSGVEYGKGLKAVEELRSVFGEDRPLSLVALRWILMFDEVSCVIPGASKPEQIRQNAQASEMEPLTEEEMTRVREIYETHIKPDVHHLW
jgi:aryl-alcohol dehydrogenase-like predicted oxidoreductase